MSGGKAIRFKSGTAIKAEQDETQRAREVVLKKAKQKYEAEEARIEKARRAGEGTWMLDSLSKRLDNEQKMLAKSKKKKKKDKKEKKKKKKKKKNKSSSSSSSDSEDEPQWVESGNTVPLGQKGPIIQRESWMEAPLDLIPLTSRQEIRDKINQEKADARKEADKLLEPGQHVRELNPYWKDGGTGLPEEKPVATKTTATSFQAAGDGGVAWLRMSLKRCKQQAEDDGRSLESVAAERWGSLDNLLTKLKFAEEQQRGNDRDHRERDSRPWEQRGTHRERRWKASSSEKEKLSRDKHDRLSGEGGEARDHGKRRDRDFQLKLRPRYSSGESSDDERQNKDYSDRRRRDNQHHKRERRRSKDRQKSDERETSQRGTAFRRPESDDSDNEKRKSHFSKSKGFMRPLETSEETGKPSRCFQRPPKDDRKTALTSSRKFVKPAEGDSVVSSGGSLRSNDSVPRWKKKVKEDGGSVGGEKSEGIKDMEKGIRRKKSRTPSSSSSGSSSESEHSEKEENQVPPPVKILSEEELNDLAAKILRAEIMGDDDMAAELRQKLEISRRLREESKSGTDSMPDFSARRGETGERRGRQKRKDGSREEREEEGEDVVVLSRTNKAGMVRPVLGSGSDADPWGKPSRKKRKKKVATHDETGSRTTYFDNDDKFDLKTMVEQERAGTAEDQNAMFARLAGRSVDKDLDLDDMFVSRAAKQQSDQNTFDKDRAGAIFEHRKRTAAMDKCQRCLKQVPKHLIVALGTKSYVCLPAHRSLTEGHCLIVPLSHSPSATALDEDVWQEMQNFRQSLVKMFASQDQDVVVMETVMHLKHFPHTVLECVPLDREIGDLSPIYFKKAIQEAGPEWSDNKKLHDLRGKDVRKVIPKGFPYFSVDFGLQSGYATVIEDESSFPGYFGREIVGGMLDAEPTLWRKPHKQSFEDQRQKVLQFEKWWKPFDWTQDINS